MWVQQWNHASLRSTGTFTTRSSGCLPIWLLSVIGSQPTQVPHPPHQRANELCPHDECNGFAWPLVTNRDDYGTRLGIGAPRPQSLRVSTAGRTRTIQQQNISNVPTLS